MPLPVLVGAQLGATMTTLIEPVLKALQGRFSAEDFGKPGFLGRLRAALPEDFRSVDTIGSTETAPVMFCAGKPIDGKRNDFFFDMDGNVYFIGLPPFEALMAVRYKLVMNEMEHRRLKYEATCLEQEKAEGTKSFKTFHEDDHEPGAEPVADLAKEPVRLN